MNEQSLDTVVLAAMFLHGLRPKLKRMRYTLMAPIPGAAILRALAK